MRLRSSAVFHDGSPVDAASVVEILQKRLPAVLRSLNDDIESISANGPHDVVFKLRQPSTFVEESFVDVPIQKAGNVGTGPFATAASAASGARLTSNDRYYLGAPSIKEIDVTTYPNLRAAWAELLRHKFDMLYEVGVETVDVTPSKTLALYEFDRPYQYILILNAKAPNLSSPEVRRALNLAIDRGVLVRDALRTHGVPSAGPVSLHHRDFVDIASTFRFDPAAAAALLAQSKRKKTSGGAALTIRCLTLPGPPFERLAMLVKQQLAAVGVQLDVEEAAPDRVVKAFTSKDFDAVLMEVISGWNMFRPYRWWHSKGDLNVGFSSAKVDEALDAVRRAPDKAAYKSGVAAFQRAVAEDPPAIFLAWGSRSRAVSTQFQVQQQPGADIIGTMRTWKAVPADKMAGRP